LKVPAAWRQIKLYLAWVFENCNGIDAFLGGDMVCVFAVAKIAAVSEFGVGCDG